MKIKTVETKKKEEWSETNSSLSEGDHFEKEHKNNLSESTIVEKHLSNEKMLS